ncbi:uncharacterized protein LOC125701229 isoform X2 [Lagopus muta]|uniref:uncharacterized protein LOC125701229 isoform X1 n=2 Tax=Lagopus muta TaxID=64668 RepID=UPI0020A1F5CA|nr:uncharacterized protein LOC125701229 isoform X1 [Lagopus muta]XP_048818879.1 uncharacterized protein LOC125701229 isoform X2 [Lagopus muta]
MRSGVRQQDGPLQGARGKKQSGWGLHPWAQSGGTGGGFNYKRGDSAQMSINYSEVIRAGQAAPPLRRHVTVTSRPSAAPPAAVTSPPAPPQPAQPRHTEPPPALRSGPAAAMPSDRPFKQRRTFGIPIISTMDNTTTLQYAGLLQHFIVMARSIVRDIDPQNDLTFLRIRSKKNEIMIAPEKDYFLIVIQNTNE